MTTSPAYAALALTILALTVYRLAILATVEDGPWMLARRWREWVTGKRGMALDPTGLLDPDALAELDWITAGVSCPLCASFWLALPAAILWGVLTGAPLLLTLAVWPALSAVTVWRER